MSNLKSFLIEVVPKSKKVIKKIGDVELQEIVFEVEKAFRKETSKEGVDLVQINPQDLLPQATSKYLTIRQASEEIGVNKSQLRRLIKKGVIEAIKLQGKWLLLRESLYQYRDLHLNLKPKKTKTKERTQSK